MHKSLPSFLRTLALFFVLFSCKDVKESDEYRKIAFDRDSLAEALDNQDAVLKNFATEFDKIESNLSSIDSNKSKILKISIKENVDQRDRIHALIADIYIAIDQNQSTIKSLEAKVRNKAENPGLASMLKSIKRTLLAKETEIALLEKELSKMKLEVNNLKEAVAFKEKQLVEKDTLLAKQGMKLENQEKLIAQKEEELNKVYYILGTSKELEKSGIIKKEGGIVGLGSVKILGEKLSGDKMKTLNSKKDKFLLIGNYTKKKVITTHPSDSYFFIAKEGLLYLKISFPEKFWSLSKYLVIVVE